MAPGHASGLNNASEIVKNTDGGPVVELNVGGTVFATQLKTLTARSGFFKTLFESRIMWMPHSFFIDRSPELFAQLLEVMRTGRLPQAVDNMVQLVSLRACFITFNRCCFVRCPQTTRSKV